MDMPGERIAVLQVVEVGKQYGFGNLISRLRIAWAIRLVEDHELDVETACEAAGVSKDEAARFGKSDRNAFLIAAKNYTFEG